MGKGSQRRPEDRSKINANWDKIFSTGKNKGSAVDDNSQAAAGQSTAVRDVQQEGYNQAGNRGRSHNTFV
jgi:predicted DNA-binding WGR domain protein